MKWTALAGHPAAIAPRKKSSEKLGAVILAGGQSRRMGQDKAAIKWEGQPLLAHIVGALRTSCDPVVVVHGREQALAPVRGATLIPDPADRANAGPLVAVATGLAALSARGVTRAFLTGCDAPFVSSAHARALADRMGDADQAIAPSRDGHLQVLSAVVRVAPALHRAGELISTGERSLKALFGGLAVQVVDEDTLPDPRALMTCNTPEELAALRELARSSP